MPTYFPEYRLIWRLFVGYGVSSYDLTLFYNDTIATPGPWLMRIHLVQNSTSAKFQKSPNIHLVRPIIHLVRIFALSSR